MAGMTTLIEPRNLTPLDDFLFDLNGYLVLKNAAEPELIAELNHAFDTFPPLQRFEWWGNAMPPAPVLWRAG
jgi:hypothetical protein